jgi:general secretion pathway protein A
LAQPSFNEDHPHPVLEQPPTVPHDHGLTEPSVTEDRPQPVLEPTIPEPPAPALAQPFFSEEHPQPVFEQPPAVLRNHGSTEPSFTEDRPEPVLEPTIPEPPAPALARPTLSEENQQPAIEPPMLPSSAAFSRSSLNEEQAQPVFEPPTLESPAPALASASSREEQQQPVLEQPPEQPGTTWIDPSFQEEHQPLLELPPEPDRPTPAPSSFIEEHQPLSEPHPAPLAFVRTSADAPTEDPFGSAPDTQFFFPSTYHREALGILFHQIRSRAGFLALVGAPGTGKSIVLERLMDLLANETEFAFLLNPKITAPEFFELIAHDFELPCAGASKVRIVIALNEHLAARSSAGLTTALIVDNAQKLSTEVLEEIELLGNLETRNGRLLQVVFAGQPSFERRLDAPELRGLKQRLLTRARLEPLDEKQTAAYILHRMEKAGRTQSVFPADGLAEIYRRTRGLPRLINALCGRLLELCRGLQVKTASMRLVEQAADDLGLDGHNESLKRLREVSHP